MKNSEDKFLLIALLITIVMIISFMIWNKPHTCEGYKDRPISQVPAKCIENFLKEIKP